VQGADAGVENGIPRNIAAFDGVKPRIAGDLHQSLRRRGIERQIVLDHFYKIAMIQRPFGTDQGAAHCQDAPDILLWRGANYLVEADSGAFPAFQ
jgi:hypothetical protein